MLKINNDYSKKILSLITMSPKPLTVSDLKSATPLSYSAIEVVTESLIKDGMIECEAFFDSKIGSVSLKFSKKAVN